MGSNLIYCTKCGMKNNFGDLYCLSCGNQIGGGSSAGQNWQKSARSKPIGEQVNTAETKIMTEFGQTGKRIGEQFRKTGEDLGKGMERTGKRASEWYDRTTGIFGPMIFALFSLLLLVLVVLSIMILAEERRVWVDLTDFVLTYLPLFFMLGLLSSYSTYFSRKYHSRFKWATPITAAVSITAAFWIVARIMAIIDQSLEVPYIRTIYSWIDLLLPVIFALVIVVGYLGLSLKEATRNKRIR